MRPRRSAVIGARWAGRAANDKFGVEHDLRWFDGLVFEAGHGPTHGLFEERLYRVKT